MLLATCVTGGGTECNQLQGGVLTAIDWNVSSAQLGAKADGHVPETTEATGEITAPPGGCLVASGGDILWRGACVRAAALRTCALQRTDGPFRETLLWNVTACESGALGGGDVYRW
ncbi:hypothetical protein BWQ96_09919 [Gracilariopsis chorda]|uniref:Uncharacterized protein n=1 Tax=Gracilariopsis chorda TaxID=448386 RepID=A0A2V3IE68_9FLOR|nr:hypothetical protein BWQ96_09919 [Gracilariopsis chorda]|eukprot:PXF40363.1 hypothetical protein BWQ96_09919 [Gracilariopsis chorda]